MAKVVFSNWGEKVVDNRTRSDEAESDSLAVKLPAELAPGIGVVGLVGWDGITLFGDDADAIDMVRAYMEAVKDYSCERCTTCRIGAGQAYAILSAAVEGRGHEEDVDLLASLAVTMRETAMCSLGQTAAIPLAAIATHFRGEYGQLVRGERRVKSTGYHTKLTAPCINACPVHLDIPGYVEMIRQGRYQESLDLIRERNVLPGVCGRVCVHPCEEVCRRGQFDQPVSVKALKRFVADCEIELDRMPTGRTPDPDRPKMAVIGAGPAGLAAASALARLGYPVTVFEALPVPGGMAAVGIPAYRLPKDVLQREVDAIANEGVEFVYNARLGKDFTLEELRERGHTAVFVGIGCHNTAKMGIEGEDAGYEGYLPGVEFLRDLALGEPTSLRGKAVVVGGGNVAMDCARSSLRLGFSEVTLVYRRSRAEMPANEEEIEEAEHEGVRYNFLTNPTRLVARDGKVVGVELVRMELGEPDASGRRRPVPVPGSEFVLECDVVIPAIGQVTDTSCFAAADGIDLSRRKTVTVNQFSMQTSQPGVFAGGDCVSGPATLIQAMAAGREAAHAMDRYVRGESPDISADEKVERVVREVGAYQPREDGVGGEGAWQYFKRPPVIDFGAEDVGIAKERQRPAVPCLPVSERLQDFRGVETAFAPLVAVEESERCLRCYRIALVATREEKK
ncbi:MAG: FAD-dependent oxidoreductase [Dehalococcoidales bacterium]|nr:FAD-dependent oxidoreductase [Dehalococcoidales bacterium]